MKTPISTQNSIEIATAEIAVDGDDRGVEARGAQVVARASWQVRPCAQAVSIRMPGQRRARDEARVGREHQHDERDGDRRDDARPLRRRARLLVDRRARQRARAGHALEEAAGEVREPLAQALLVHVELLAGDARRSPSPSRSLRAGRAARSRARCSASSRISGASSVGQREATAARPGSRRPPRRPAASSPSHAVDGRHHDRRRSGTRAAAASRAARFSQRSAEHQRDRRRARSASVGAWIAAALASCVSQKRTRKWSCDVADRLQAEQVLHLIEHQQHARAGGEADDHRVRDVAREVAEPQQRDAELDRADQERQQDRRLDPLVLARDASRWRSAARSRSRWSGR